MGRGIGKDYRLTDRLVLRKDRAPDTSSGSRFTGIK
jgi:hypothetical protein